MGRGQMWQLTGAQRLPSVRVGWGGGGAQETEALTVASCMHPKCLQARISPLASVPAWHTSLRTCLVMWKTSFIIPHHRSALPPPPALFKAANWPWFSQMDCWICFWCVYTKNLLWEKGLVCLKVQFECFSSCCVLIYPSQARKCSWHILLCLLVEGVSRIFFVSGSKWSVPWTLFLID